MIGNVVYDIYFIKGRQYSMGGKAGSLNLMTSDMLGEEMLPWGSLFTPELPYC